MAIHPPQQVRAQETWTRVLDSGAQILAEHGISGFSIGAVSERSAVSVGSIYARVDGVDDLFEAIHEHVMIKLDEGSEFIGLLGVRTELPVKELLELVVRSTIEQWHNFRGELRAFILRAAVDEKIRQLGANHLMKLEKSFLAALSTRASEIPHPDPQVAIVATFRLLIDALGWDTAFGSNFGSQHLPIDDLNQRLQRMCVLYLLTPTSN